MKEVTTHEDEGLSDRAVETVRDAETNEGPTVHESTGAAADDDEYARLREENVAFPSPRSEPSTDTANLNVGGSLRGAHEATTEDINGNHSSMMPVEEEVAPQPTAVEESIPAEGAGAMEDVGEICPRTAPTRREKDSPGSSADLEELMGVDERDQGPGSGSQGEEGHRTSSPSRAV